MPLAAAAANVKSEDAPVDVEVNLLRDPGKVEERRAPPRQQQPAEAAEQRQQHRFGQPLAHQPRAAGADAALTAVSRRRETERATSRLVTLAHAIRSTSATATASR